jgi:hypothetical protein
MDSERQNISWALWGRWLLATVIGWGVGIIFAIVLSYAVVNLFHPEETNLIVGLCVGAGVGSAQVIASRRMISSRWGWVLGTIAGIGIPYTINVLLAEGWLGTIQVSKIWLVLIVIVAGVLAGVLQVASLMRHTLRARWWIWTSVITWCVTWFISLTLHDPGFIVGVLAYGSMSGAILIWLVRTSPSR